MPHKGKKESYTAKPGHPGKTPKGSHIMPNGVVMKDSDMKHKKKGK